jgi:hypothetical protein
MLPVILVLVPQVSVCVLRCSRLIIWKVLKTQLFPVFNGFRVNPQAEVRILQGLDRFQV